MVESSIKFYVSDYVRETYVQAGHLSESYDLSPVPEGADLPYSGICIAQKVGESAPESLFKCDSRTSFSDSLAKRMMEDKDCKVYTRAGILSSCNTTVLQYYLPLYNPKAIRFMPSIDMPVSNSMNVDSEVGIEVRFAFDDGYTFSIIKRFKTGGSFSLSFLDMVNECKEELECPAKDFFEVNLKDCHNATYNKDEKTWSILVSSETGRVIEQEFSVETDQDMRIAAAELARAVCCFRIVEFNETIH